MGELVVEPLRLHRTAQELASAAERLGAVSGRLSGAGAGAVGGLAGALEDFARDWRHGLRQLGEAAAATGAQLTEAARAYSEVDGAVAEACR